MRDQVTVLGDQRAKYWYELSRADILYLDYLRHHVVRTGRASGPNWTGELPGRRIGKYFDQISAGDSDIAVYLKD